MKFTSRQYSPQTVTALIDQGVHPLLAQLYAARGVQHQQELQEEMALLLPPQQLLGAALAGQLLAQAIAQQQAICIIADYDCDGATACAVAIRGLRLLGATKVSYIVPNRVTDGYGLTPELAQRAQQQGAQLIVTVDNGVASIEGVNYAKQLGLGVIITDHHLPLQLGGQVQLPAADAIVNPNQPDCQFGSKHLAGVGVMFYVLLAARASMRAAGRFTVANQPKLDSLLPLVALGTIADVVKLDNNNRRLVAQGLKRIRAGQMPPGMMQLFAVSGRSFRQATSDDLGFALAPRINAAGRLSDMTLGVDCLITDDATMATNLAQQLEQMNKQRRSIEQEMRQQAWEITETWFQQGKLPANPTNLCLYDAAFHEGVVGIVAARVKEKLHCPTFVFANSMDPEQGNILKGSGRSVAGIHLKDVLDAISKDYPQLLLKFGGHAMAAGCSILEQDIALFRRAFDTVVQRQLTTPLNANLETDGKLPLEFCTIECAQMLKQEVWGQGFPTPLFSAGLQVLSQRLIGNDQHSSLKVEYQGQVVAATWFGHTAPLPQQATFAFSIDVNQWRGNETLTFRISAMERD